MGAADINEPEFLSNLESVLTEPQKAKLKETLEQLERNPSGEFQVVDVFNAALACKPTPEQATKLATLKSDTHARVQATAPLDDAKRLAILEWLINEVRGVLTPEQQKAFAARVDAGLASARAKAATSQPAGTPAGTPTP
jgi:hypothetical protein